jgi:hypothetical protein
MTVRCIVRITNEGSVWSTVMHIPISVRYDNQKVKTKPATYTQLILSHRRNLKGVNVVSNQ